MESNPNLPLIVNFAERNPSISRSASRETKNEMQRSPLHIKDEAPMHPNLQHYMYMTHNSRLKSPSAIHEASKIRIMQLGSQLINYKNLGGIETSRNKGMIPLLDSNDHGPARLDSDASNYVSNLHQFHSNKYFYNFTNSALNVRSISNFNTYQN